MRSIRLTALTDRLAGRSAVPFLAAGLLAACSAPEATHLGAIAPAPPLDPPAGSVPAPAAPGPCAEPPTPADVTSWTYAMNEMPARIPPGAEYIGCDRMVVRKPPTPRAAFLTAFYSNVDPGTHHQVLFFDDADLLANRTCSGDYFTPLFDTLDRTIKGGADFLGTVLKNPTALGTGVGEYLWAMPEGYGIFLSADGRGHWVTNHHYLNASPKDTTVGGIYEVQASDRVRSPLTLLAGGAADGAIDVPPHSSGRTEGTLIAPFDVDLVIAGSHMHNYGVRFEQRFFDGDRTLETPFYTSETWDSPRAQVLKTPIRLRRGQGITYRCEFRNDTDAPVKYAKGGFDGTKGQEMCSVWSYVAYPRGHGFAGLVPPVLTADIHQSGAQATLQFNPSAQEKNEGIARAACGK